MITFSIPGEPQGKGRPRFTRNGHTYTPDVTACYENLVKLMFTRAYPGFVPLPKECSVSARITAYFAIPKSTSKIKRAAMLRGDLKPTKKPDCDNIAKIILDALNGLAYHDDAQVTSLDADKFYSETPRVEVELT